MTPTIFIIDDDIVSQFASRYAIEQTIANAKIYTSDNAADALASITVQRNSDKEFPDLIILDLVMPGMGGWEFINQFQQAGLRTKIFILSAFTNSTDRDKAADHPLVVGYFDKPLTKMNVQKVLRSIYQ